MKKIKIYFAQKTDHLALQEKIAKNFEIELDDNADFVFSNEYPVVNRTHPKAIKKYPIRVFYTGENVAPDFNIFDYAISFEKIHFSDRHITYPSCYRHIELLSDQDIQTMLTPLQHKNSLFCNFIYSNKKAHPYRDFFYKKLSNYKKIDSLGKHMNNRPDIDSNTNIVNLRKGYKFSIAFENATSVGYTTEKIVHAFASKTIPIYWGNPDVATLFNPKAFIDCSAYKSFDEVIEKIKEIDNDENIYLSMLHEPFMTEEQYNKYYKARNDLDRFLHNILMQDVSTARRRSYGTWNTAYEQKFFLLFYLKSIVIFLRKIKQRIMYKKKSN